MRVGRRDVIVIDGLLNRLWRWREEEKGCGGEGKVKVMRGWEKVKEGCSGEVVGGEVDCTEEMVVRLRYRKTG